jgi:acetyl-CoA carboxylase biotin carboxyl carrier protein
MTTDPGVNQLLGAIDRLEELLAASELSEIEVEAGGTTLIVRKPRALAAAIQAGASASGGRQGGAESAAGQTNAAALPVREESRYHAVVAPLTGVYYGSPSPGAAAYLREGGTVNAGQVIGLIEAMKLFNEIKSDVTGTVRRIAAESGALVKAKQTLIEVEPS